MSHADWMAIAALHVECTEPATLTAEADLGSATLCSVPRGAVLRCVGHAVLDCGLRRRVVYGEHTGWISAERFMISSPLVFGREEDDEFFVQACAMSGVQVARRIDEDDMRIDGLLPPCLRGDAETVDEEVAAADGTAASSAGRTGRSTRAPAELGQEYLQAATKRRRLRRLQPVAETPAAPAEQVFRRPAARDARGRHVDGPRLQRAEAEVRRLQACDGPETLTSRVAFARIVRDVMDKEGGQEKRISSEALRLLQFAAETHATETLVAWGKLAIHAKRITPDERDCAMLRWVQSHFTSSQR